MSKPDFVDNQKGNLLVSALKRHLQWRLSNENSVNLVDGDKIPARHFGVILEWSKWELLQNRIKKYEYLFLVKPKIRFKSKPGEQGTFFVNDPSGNALEFKAFKNDSMVFKKF